MKIHLSWITNVYPVLVVSWRVCVAKKKIEEHREMKKICLVEELLLLLLLLCTANHSFPFIFLFCLLLLFLLIFWPLEKTLFADTEDAEESSSLPLPCLRNKMGSLRHLKLNAPSLLQNKTLNDSFIMACSSRRAFRISNARWKNGISMLDLSLSLQAAVCS